MRNILLLSLSLNLFLSCLCYGQSNTDSCDSLLPASLKYTIKTQYPKYRIGRSSDYSKEALVMQYDNKPNACPAVAAADVNADGATDYAFFMINESQDLLLVAAVNRHKKEWKLYKLYDFRKGELGNSYVEPIKAGRYQDLYANSPEYEDETGRLRNFASKRSGFIAGSMESSGVAFFFSGNRWVHLWLSD
jgi:hypothetical protein